MQMRTVTLLVCLWAAVVVSAAGPGVAAETAAPVAGSTPVAGAAGGAGGAPVVTSKVAASAVATFHCLSLYWSPEQGAAGRKVFIRFREVNEAGWHDGLALRYNPVKAAECKSDYRGSIVNLKPGTRYEIALTLEGTDLTTVLKAATWSEKFPVASTTVCGSSSATLEVKNSGTPEGYILYDGTGSTIDGGNKVDHGILVDASYVILRGFTIKNVKLHGIRINSHHVVIEDCDISQWGTEDQRGFGVGYQGGIWSNRKDMHNVVIQRCKIHHPSWDSNSWAEDHFKDHKSRHPDGPQAIVFWESEGNNVIRYNECWSDADHYYNDILGGGQNGSYRGYPGPDSDIYGNYLANCWDDGIEVEGGGQNVRIWNNYIENTMMTIGDAANSIGPLYLWRNVGGRSYSPPGSEWNLTHGCFMKMGYADGERWMTGQMYVFNNTIFQPKDEGAEGLGGSGKLIKHCVTRNNILQARSKDTHSIATEKNSIDNDFDYDLLSGRYPSEQEKHGIQGTPRYVAEAGFVFETRTGNFQLASDSPGVDAGEVIPNFCEVYGGARPDLGAQEIGSGAVVYGVKAVFVPPGSAAAAGGNGAGTATVQAAPKLPAYGPERAPAIEKIRAQAATLLAGLIVAHPGTTSVLMLGDKPTEVTLAGASAEEGLTVKAYGASHKLAWGELSSAMLAGLIETLSTEEDKAHAEHLCAAALLYLIDGKNVESSQALNRMMDVDDGLAADFKEQAAKLR